MLGVRELMKDGPSELKGVFSAIEARDLQTHVQDKWKPMIMSFQKLYGLKDGEFSGSTLADIEEETYRLPV